MWNVVGEAVAQAQWCDLADMPPAWYGAVLTRVEIRTAWWSVRRCTSAGPVKAVLPRSASQRQLAGPRAAVDEAGTSGVSVQMNHVSRAQRSIG